MQPTVQPQVGCMHKEHTRLQNYYAEEGLEISHQSLPTDYICALHYVLWGACEGALWRQLALEGNAFSCL